MYNRINQVEILKKGVFTLKHFISEKYTDML